MEGHCGGTYLNTRCAISTFKKYAEPLLNVLSEDSLEQLRNSSLLQLFSIPDIPQNIPLLYTLLRLYRPDKDAFLLGKYYIKFTVNEVALILGLPNMGEDFDFQRLPYSQVKQGTVVDWLKQLANDVISPELEERRLTALLIYALSKFFFPLKSLTVPECLLNFRGLDEFRRFNLPKAVHNFLQSQFAPLHKLSCIRGESSSLGYLEGCSILLVVWFFEHTNIQVPADDLARPRICRWYAKGSFSNKFCTDLSFRLWPKKEIITSFANILENERNLLGEEEVESSFETVKRMKQQKKKRRVEKKVEFTKEERNNKENKDMKRYISREISDLKCQIKSLSKQIGQLTSYTHDNVTVMIDLIKSLSNKKDKMARKGEKGQKSDTENAKKGEKCDNEMGEKDEKVKKDEKVEKDEKDDKFEKEEKGEKSDTENDKKGERSNVHIEECIGKEDSFPGRIFLSECDRELIDSTYRRFPLSGNIALARSCIDDLLQDRWLSGAHLDAFAVLLTRRRNTSPQNCCNFLYVSPSFWYQKSCGFSNSELLLEHLTTSNLKAADIILIPVFLSDRSHWTLLVSNVKRETWYFYDSLPNKTHRNNLRAVVAGLREAKKDVLPEKFHDWPIVSVDEAPTQDNGNDCGVFVLKYMETLTSREKICWSKHKNCHTKMLAFRAEIVCELIRCFVIDKKD